jgi:hypothetical protein
MNLKCVFETFHNIDFTQFHLHVSLSRMYAYMYIVTLFSFSALPLISAVWIWWIAFQPLPCLFCTNTSRFRTL